MSKKALITTSIISLLFGGCIIQQPPQQTQTSQPQMQYHYPEPSGPTYSYEYRQWNGPGWYYGVYFRNESRYRSWRNQRKSRRYYYRNKRAYPAPQTRDQRQKSRRDRHAQIQRHQRMQSQLAPQYQPPSPQIQP